MEWRSISWVSKEVQLSIPVWVWLLCNECWAKMLHQPLHTRYCTFSIRSLDIRTLSIRHDLQGHCICTRQRQQWVSWGSPVVHSSMSAMNNDTMMNRLIPQHSIHHFSVSIVNLHVPLFFFSPTQEPGNMAVIVSTFHHHTSDSQVNSSNGTRHKAKGTI